VDASDRDVRHAILSSDTAPEAERTQIEIWRHMTPGEKLSLVDRASREIIALALAGIRMRHPGASERECLIRLAELRLGPRLVREAYPDADELLGRRP
jgi:hypothetical protein